MRLRPRVDDAKQAVCTGVEITKNAGLGLYALCDIVSNQRVISDSNFVSVASTDINYEARELIETSRTETVFETCLHNGESRFAVYGPRFLRSSKPKWFMMNHASESKANMRADWDARSTSMVFSSTSNIRANDHLLLFYGHAADRLFTHSHYK
jgi:hypothetical protein